jgi:hypothetical protein
MTVMRSLGAACALAGLVAGCGGVTGDEAETTEELGGAELKIGFAGMNLHQFANPAASEIYSSTASPPTEHVRTCHGYAPWEIAHDSYRAAEPAMAAFFDGWYEHTTAPGPDHCDQLLVSFKAWRRANGYVGADERYPQDPARSDELKDAFLAFRQRYPAVTLFTAWNEPNNRSDSEAGLWPVDAAKYYLALRSVCHPSQGCLVATGDILGWTGAGDFQMRCSGNPDDGCADGSYLDQFKYHLRHWSDHFGLGADFHPEFVAYHPWWDSFQYTRHGMHCDSVETCATRAILNNLGGKWSHALLWATEVGADQKARYPVGPEDDELQACAVSFLQRVFALSPRITRFYYFDFCGLTRGQKSACEDSAPGPALTVLRDRERHHRPAHGSCP